MDAAIWVLVLLLDEFKCELRQPWRIEEIMLVEVDVQGRLLYLVRGRLIQPSRHFLPNAGAVERKYSSERSVAFLSHERRQGHLRSLLVATHNNFGQITTKLLGLLLRHFQL